MADYTCLVGLDQPEYAEIQARCGSRVIAHEVIPRIVIREGQLYVASLSGSGMLPVSRVVFHGIFEDDFDFISALALWRGPCLPHARAMMDCRLKLPCLARAVEHSQFAQPARSYAAPNTPFESSTTRVAKWGNWHCGENKAIFIGTWESPEPCIIEPFLIGNSVRVVLIGDQAWQIELAGDDWLKSIHHAQARFVDVDTELLQDTRTIAKAIGLEVIANDYLVTSSGSKHLLEVNHIPNITRFVEIRNAYLDYVVDWLKK